MKKTRKASKPAAKKIKKSGHTGQDLYIRAKRLIPGGTQLLSKRPEQFLPDQWPAYYSRAKGCTVWDLDGRALVDFTTNGIGACVLGFANSAVDAAVTKCVKNGSMCTLNAPEEVALAERLCQIHPWAEKVRYARTGGESMSIAVRLARAGTGRSTIAFCGYHGWSDWYLAANLSASNALGTHLLPGLDPAGVPQPLSGSALPFRYNEISELEKIVSAHRSDLAAIVMEPMRGDYPRDGFLQKVRALADETGAVLIFDEITAGWRSNFGGMHLQLGVNPDMAVFAKSISNGYPMAAIIGKGSVMEAAQLTFVSSTYWTERLGTTAALATINEMGRIRASNLVKKAGEQVQAGWKAAADKHGVPAVASGLPFSHLHFECGELSRAALTLFTQEMLDRGYLSAGGYYPTIAHTSGIIVKYLKAVDEVFAFIRQRLDRGDLLQALRGPVAQSGFARVRLEPIAMKAAQILKQKLNGGSLTLGALATFHVWPALLEIVMRAGLDYLIIDLEHLTHDHETVANICATARLLDFPVLIRPPQADYLPVRLAADLGPCGMLIPYVESVADLGVVQDAIYLKPRGKRGRGGHGNRWTTDLSYKGWKTQVEDDFIILPQIESKAGLANVEAIAKHPLTTAMAIGPYDLSADFGLCWEPEHPDLVGAWKRIRAAAAAVGKNMWAIGDSAELVRKGYTFICVGEPTQMLEGMLKQTVGTARGLKSQGK